MELTRQTHTLAFGWFTTQRLSQPSTTPKEPPMAAKSKTPKAKFQTKPPAKNRRVTVVHTTTSKTQIDFPKIKNGYAEARFLRHDDGTVAFAIDITGVDPSQVERMVDFVMMEFRKK